MIDASNLKGVPETMMIPLMGRALETQKSDGILHDPKSVEIMERLNYDFGRFADEGSKRSFFRTTIRTAIIDRLLSKFLKDSPSATVVELGCGLNTRFERVDNGRLRWFDLDVPEAHEIRSQFFEDDERRRFLPYSAFDAAWTREVESAGGPYFFISEASVIYFPERRVKALFEMLSRTFPGARYLFDSATPTFVKSLEKDDALKYCSVRMQWTAERIDLIRKWIPGIEFLRTVDLEYPDPEFAALYPPGFKAETAGYQLNLVKWGGK